MTPEAIRAAYMTRAPLVYRWHERGLDCHARCYVEAIGKARRVRIIVSRTDGSSFSRWVSPDELSEGR